MRRMQIAIALGLLAGLVTLAIMADSDRQDKTAPAAEVMTIDQFIFIAKSGLPEELQAALETNSDVNKRDRRGRTARPASQLGAPHARPHTRHRTHARGPGRRAVGRSQTEADGD